MAADNNEITIDVVEKGEDEEEDGEDTGFNEQYLKNELLQSHISHKTRRSSLIVSPEKVREAQNIVI